MVVAAGEQCCVLYVVKTIYSRLTLWTQCCIWYVVKATYSLYSGHIFSEEYNLFGSAWPKQSTESENKPGCGRSSLMDAEDIPMHGAPAQADPVGTSSSNAAPNVCASPKFYGLEPLGLGVFCVYRIQWKVFPYMLLLLLSPRLTNLKSVGTVGLGCLIAVKSYYVIILYHQWQVLDLLPL